MLLNLLLFEAMTMLANGIKRCIFGKQWGFMRMTIKRRFLKDTMQLPVLMTDVGTLLDPFSKAEKNHIFQKIILSLFTVNKQGINYHERRQENKCMPERNGKVSLTERILSSVQQFPTIYAAAETTSTLTM